jgi:hypothetical protein
VTYEDTVRALKHHYREHQQVVAYQSQLKAKSHQSCMSLQELPAAIKQLACWVFVKLPKDFHLKEGSLCIHQWHEGPGSEVTSS